MNGSRLISWSAVWWDTQATELWGYPVRMRKFPIEAVPSQKKASAPTTKSVCT